MENTSFDTTQKPAILLCLFFSMFSSKLLDALFCLQLHKFSIYTTLFIYLEVVFNYTKKYRRFASIFLISILAFVNTIHSKSEN